MHSLVKMKVEKRVYEVLEEQLKSKKRTLYKEFWRIKSKEKKFEVWQKEERSFKTSKTTNLSKS